MPSPSSSSSTSSVPDDYLDLNTNALLDLVKWGGPAGSGTSLSFSFPWTTNSMAYFAGYGGGAYSTSGEDTASYHYGLSAVQQDAARSALSQWSHVARISFTEVADTQTNVGDIRFAWTSASHLDSLGQQAWGWASFPDSYWPSGGDVWLSTASSGATDPSWAAGSANYESLMHEVGHAIGLKHPFEGTATLSAAFDNKQYSVMSYTEAPHSLFVSLVRDARGTVTGWKSFNVEPDTPMLLDIAAAQYLYGPNLSYRAGNDVYTFDPATPFIRTIWDAGGNDTLSVANFARGCTLDLRPGHFSDIAITSESTTGYHWLQQPPTATYDGTDNLAIAYGTIIENAVGGGGNDVVIGNDAANRLEGGAGNDTLDGGAGIDSARFSGPRAGYTLTVSGSNATVRDNASLRDGTDTLTNVERLLFSDVNVALDIAGNAGQAYRLYQAAFDRAPDLAGLGFQIGAFDGGWGRAAIAQNFINSPEFQNKYGALNDTQFVTQLYANVLHRAPDAGGLAFHLNDLQHGLSRADVLAQFSESQENQAQVIGAIQNGMVYTV